MAPGIFPERMIWLLPWLVVGSQSICHPHKDLLKSSSSSSQLINEWKYLELVSPSNNHLDLDFCINKDSFCLDTNQKMSCNSIILCFSPSVKGRASSLISKAFSSTTVSLILLWISPKCTLLHSFKPSLVPFNFSFSTNAPHPIVYCSCHNFPTTPLKRFIKKPIVRDSERFGPPISDHICQ